MRLTAVPILVRYKGYPFEAGGRRQKAEVRFTSFTSKLL
jgi:hypothetical protein